MTPENHSIKVVEQEENSGKIRELNTSRLIDIENVVRGIGTNAESKDCICRFAIILEN